LHAVAGKPVKVVKVGKVDVEPEVHSVELSYDRLLDNKWG
jgi:hypothetical protein